MNPHSKAKTALESISASYLVLTETNAVLFLKLRALLPYFLKGFNRFFTHFRFFCISGVVLSSLYIGLSVTPSLQI